MLTDEQWTVLEMMVNRIIPADDFPGGWEAGVGDYLARQFQGDLMDRISIYRAGLDALDQEARSDRHLRFADLSPSEQDALLTRVEEGDVTSSWPINPKQFFRMAVGHALEGFYADPGNGGNHDGVSWRMIGFEVRG